MENTVFKSNLLDSKPSEAYIAGIMRKKHPKTELTSEIYGDVKFSEYDILVERPDGSEITIEVKQDTASKLTQKVAIEYECYGKPSGIRVTTATYWAIIFWSRLDGTWLWVLIDTNALNQKIQHAEQKEGGHKGASKMYLIPTASFLHDPCLKCRPVPDDMVKHLNEVHGKLKEYRSQYKPKPLMTNWR
jgi:hypothetical protein